MFIIADVIRKIVESLRRDANNSEKGNRILVNQYEISIRIIERYSSIYRFEVPFLFGALRSIGR